MTNRNLGLIIKDQDPLTISAHATVQYACQRMWLRRVGAALITDEKGHLVGIFTGRDAVRALAEDREPRSTPLAAVMTTKPDTIGPEATAIDALRMMQDGGYRHLPIVSGNDILGIVSRGDFRGLELDRLEEESGLWEKLG